MSNIHVIHGEVPELIDRETEQLTQKYLGNEPKDDFNYVKYNLYETTLNTIIEEAMT
ncbi:TPA: DNA polymerase III subunit delta, partial [Staphylococcus pseudintermedius]|nr:DNA polymerase III subunit delta [Staphylococcus pseudintermedius]